MMNFTFMLIQYEYYSLVFYARVSNPQKVLIKKQTSSHLSDSVGKYRRFFDCDS